MEIKNKRENKYILQNNTKHGNKKLDQGSTHLLETCPTHPKTQSNGIKGRQQDRYNYQLHGTESGIAIKLVSHLEI